MTEYLSLDAIFAALKKDAFAAYNNRLLHILDRYSQTPEAVEEPLKQLLHAEGFHKLRFLPETGYHKDRGNHSVLLESSDGLLARLSRHTDPSRQDFQHHALLNPVKILFSPQTIVTPPGAKQETFQFRVDIMPYMPLAATIEEATNVLGSLIASGLFAIDADALHNVRVFEYKGERVPLLIDRDLLKKLDAEEQLAKWEKYNTARAFHKLGPVNLTDFSHDLWIDKKTGTWKQKLWDPRILTNEAGTFPEKELAEYAANHPNSSVVAAIREGELYVDELHNLLVQTAPNSDSLNPTPFKDRITTAAAALKGKSPSK